MEHHHSDYKGWKLCVTPTGPPDGLWYVGHGVRATRPHDVIMAEGPTETAVLDELHRQVDAAEDAANGAPATSPGNAEGS
jgi:hypothetical protein